MIRFLKWFGLLILILVDVAGIVNITWKKQIMRHFLPTVSVLDDIHITIKKDTSYATCILVIQNNSFLDINIDTIKYKVQLLNTSYLDNKQAIHAVLHKHASDTILFTFKLPYVTILKDLKNLRKESDSVKYSIVMSIQYSTVFGKAEFPINKSAMLKIPQPPDVEVVEVRYQKIRLKSMLANIRIKITNYADVNLKIKEIVYSMHISDRGSMHGTYSIPIEINPNTQQYVDIPVDISIKSFGKTVWDIIRNDDQYPYALELKIDLETSRPVEQKFHVDLFKNGQMELRK